MNPTRPPPWPRQLRPLQFGDLPIGTQLARRRGVVLVATALLTALFLFVQAIFTGFGSWRWGFGLGAALFGTPLGWIWWDYWQLCRAVRRYRSAVGNLATDDGPAGRTPK